jgi:hypothetical protein
MPQSLLTSQLKEKPTYRVRSLGVFIVHSSKLPAYLVRRLFLFIKRLPAPGQFLGQLLCSQLAPCLFLDECPVLFGPDLEGGVAHSTGRFLLRRRLLFFLLFGLRQEIIMFCFSVSKQSIYGICVYGFVTICTYVRYHKVPIFFIRICQY